MLRRSAGSPGVSVMGLYTDWVVPWINDTMSNSPEIRAVRQELLAGLEGVGLEIGFGTGLSLRHYPPAVKELFVLDPAKETLKRTRERIESAPIKVTRLPYSGSGPYPLPDDSVDFVASMLTLCTIPEPDAALREIRRVLKPGGRFVFLEHGAAEDPKVRKWQNRFTPVQKVVAAGCHLNRQIDDYIGRAGFGTVALERVAIHKVPKFMGRAYRGTAVNSVAP